VSARAAHGSGLGDPAPQRGQDYSRPAAGSGVPAADCDSAVMAAIMSSSIRVCPQPDVPGGRGRQHRTGARDGPARPAGLRRRRLGHRRLIRPLVRGAGPGPPNRRAARGIPSRRSSLEATNPATEVGLVTRQWPRRSRGGGSIARACRWPTPGPVVFLVLVAKPNRAVSPAERVTAGTKRDRTTIRKRH
jgi:hypothetical protein